MVKPAGTMVAKQTGPHHQEGQQLHQAEHTHGQAFAQQDAGGLRGDHQGFHHAGGFLRGHRHSHAVAVIVDSEKDDNGQQDADGVAGNIHFADDLARIAQIRQGGLLDIGGDTGL